MKHSTGNPTKAQQKRFERMCEIGCVPCIILGIYQNPPQIHHIVKGRKRLGHDYTIAKCPYHHEGHIPLGHVYENVRNRMGPSYALEPDLFEQAFGTQEELLEFQNTLLEHYIECEKQDEE